MVNRLDAWQMLQKHHQQIKTVQLADYFIDETRRDSEFKLAINNIVFDYSKNFVTHETIDLLLALAKECDLGNKIQQLFVSGKVHTSQNCPALHVALRDPTVTPVMVDGADIKPLIANALTKMACIVNKIHLAQLCGVSNKPFCHIVNIGIGGSYLGSQMATHALTEYTVNPQIKYYFIAAIDDLAISAVLQQLDPEQTLFIIASKSFTTLETMHNANIMLDWLDQQLKKIFPQLTKQEILATHCIAITAAAENAKNFGVNEDLILPLWDWVGGRYSIWATIGLPLALKIGMHNFIDFLAGGYLADQHFLHSAMKNNIPIIMALLGVWYINFFHANTQAIIPYDSRLQYLIPYLQQLDMESNGKNITCSGELVDYSTGPIIWGDLGSCGQHAFYQLLHQGTHFIPIDFITVKQPANLSLALNSALSSQELLCNSAVCQSQALLYGSADKAINCQTILGNKPSNVMMIDQLTPQSLGTLLALYEHKIFVQSVIWDINPFDQFGVCLGKEMLAKIITEKLIK